MRTQFWMSMVHGRSKGHTICSCDPSVDVSWKRECSNHVGSSHCHSAFNWPACTAQASQGNTNKPGQHCSPISAHHVISFGLQCTGLRRQHNNSGQQCTPSSAELHVIFNCGGSQAFGVVDIGVGPSCILAWHIGATTYLILRAPATIAV